MIRPTSREAKEINLSRDRRWDRSHDGQGKNAMPPMLRRRSWWVLDAMMHLTCSRVNKLSSKTWFMHAKVGSNNIHLPTWKSGGGGNLTPWPPWPSASAVYVVSRDKKKTKLRSSNRLVAPSSDCQLLVFSATVDSVMVCGSCGDPRWCNRRQNPKAKASTLKAKDQGL